MELPTLYYLFLCVHIGTAVVGGFYYKSLPRPLKILEWLLCISVFDTIGKWVFILFHGQTLWLSHYYTILELGLITFMYAAWTQSEKRRRIIILCFAGFSILWIAAKFSFEPFSYADDWTATISKVIQITFSLFILMEVIHENDIQWMNDPRLWVVSGIILYAAGTLFWFALFNKMLEDSPERLRQSYALNWVLLILSNLLFVRGFLCRK